jgi:hypothetical protein
VDTNTLLTAIRFMLLSCVVGVAVGVLTIALKCIGGCGGYGEIFDGLGFGAVAAIATFVGLCLHHERQRKSNPQSLVRQARLQWLWLAVTGVVVLLFAVFSNGF